VLRSVAAGVLDTLEALENPALGRPVLPPLLWGEPAWIQPGGPSGTLSGAHIGGETPGDAAQGGLGVLAGELRGGGKRHDPGGWRFGASRRP